MNQLNTSTQGIEVQEYALNNSEQGFLTGVYEAWTKQALTDDELRDVLLLLATSEGVVDWQALA